LILDHQGRWAALDTTVDRATSTATAHWPHFSNVLVGGVKSVGASPAGAPRRLGQVSGSVYWRTLRLSATKQKKSVRLVMAGKVVGHDDPMCCPSRTVTLTVAWTNDHFAQVSRKDIHG
jgi:hypothetical protein